jgi:hypothetical protein
MSDEDRYLEEYSKGNLKSALRTYEECSNILGKYFGGEKGKLILKHAKRVTGGLSSIVQLKRKELSDKTQLDKSGEEK